MFLVNNLKIYYYKRAKILHPDKGCNEEKLRIKSKSMEENLKKEF